MVEVPDEQPSQTRSSWRVCILTLSQGRARLAHADVHGSPGYVRCATFTGRSPCNGEGVLLYGSSLGPRIARAS